MIISGQNLPLNFTRSVWGTTLRWWTATSPPSRTTREYSETRRKSRKTSLTTPASITSTKDYRRSQISQDTISPIPKHTKISLMSILYMISSHYKTHVHSSKAAPWTNLTSPSPMNYQRFWPTTRERLLRLPLICIWKLKYQKKPNMENKTKKSKSEG